jgi:hypothetical protein
LPAGWRVTILRPSTPPPLSQDQIAAALDRPIGQPPIRELSRGRSRPLVLVDDPTRPTPAGPGVPRGRDGATYDHYALLRSIETLFHLPYLGHAGDPGTASIPALRLPGR